MSDAKIIGFLVIGSNYNIIIFEQTPLLQCLILLKGIACRCHRQPAADSQGSAAGKSSDSTHSTFSAIISYKRKYNRLTEQWPRQKRISYTKIDYNKSIMVD